VVVNRPERRIAGRGAWRRSVLASADMGIELAEANTLFFEAFSGGKRPWCAWRQ
jgi:hypothetical protein